MKGAIMLQQELNQIFAEYTSTLYKAARRMINKNHSQYEDKVQDLIVLAYEEFIRKANEGKIMDLPLVIHFMKLRKTEVQIEMRGYSRTNKTDVFNKRNFYQGKIEVYSIDNPIFDEENDSYADIISDDNDFESEISFKIDFQNKFFQLSEIEKTILDMKFNGYDDDEISEYLSIRVQTVKNTLSRLSSKFSNTPQAQLELNF
jgi:DNA-directed RNA polymerase specialized sigma24 family protein